MKTLYLLRHSKSSSDYPGISDLERPLNDRGYSDAHFISQHLRKENISVDLVLSSPAIRAISTAIIFCVNIKYAVDAIQIRKNLYDTSVKQYLQCISEASAVSSLLLVGHNETISEVAQKLSTERILGMKTCAVIALQFDIESWEEIGHTKGKMLFSIDPGSLRDE